MHPLLKSFVVVAALVSTLSQAQPEGEVIIRTRDGKSRQGRVISETQRGYLFASAKGTSVIEFANIVDLQKVEPAPEVVAATPVQAPALVSQPASAPVMVSAAPAVGTPPPPPERPLEVASSPVQERNVREGFHFGIGANVGANPGGPSASAQAHFEFNFGRPVYRVSANLGGLSMYGIGFFNVSVDNLFQFNVNDVYAFGGGVQLGFAFGTVTFAYVAPVIQPVIIKLGNRGQHQLSLTGSVAVVSNDQQVGRFDVTYAGTLQVLAGYSFLF